MNPILFFVSQLFVRWLQQYVFEDYDRDSCRDHFFSQMIPHVIYYCCVTVDKCFISPHHISSHSITHLNSSPDPHCNKRSSRPSRKMVIVLAFVQDEAQQTYFYIIGLKYLLHINTTILTSNPPQSIGNQHLKQLSTSASFSSFKSPLCYFLFFTGITLCLLLFDLKPTQPPPDPVSYTPVYLSYSLKHTQIQEQKLKVFSAPHSMLFGIFCSLLAQFVCGLAQCLGFWFMDKVKGEVDFLTVSYDLVLCLWRADGIIMRSSIRHDSRQADISFEYLNPLVHLQFGKVKKHEKFIQISSETNFRHLNQLNPCQLLFIALFGQEITQLDMHMKIIKRKHIFKGNKQYRQSHMETDAKIRGKEEGLAINIEKGRRIQEGQKVFVGTQKGFDNNKISKQNKQNKSSQEDNQEIKIKPQEGNNQH